MKKTNRYLLISFFFLSIVSFTLPLIIFNIKNRNPDLFSIRIEGNVSEEIVYTYEDIVDGVYGQINNQEFDFLNQWGTMYKVNYTGVSIWTLLTFTSIMYPNSSKIYFKSYDTYNTENLTLSQVETNPDLAIIAFKKFDNVLKYNDNDGGPLRAIINLSVTEPDYCSKYWAKFVNTIVVV